MKKLVLATLLATAFGVAQAQSVTAFGTLDASMYAITSGGTDYKGFNSKAASTSNFGIVATEDIGGGVKAGAKVETEVNLATGAIGSTSTGTAAGSFNRAANVYLSDSKLGTVTLGRQIAPIYNNVKVGDAIGINSLGFINAVVGAHALGTTNAITGETSGSRTGLGNTETTPGLFNAGIGYTTPTFNGVSASVFTTPGSGSASFASSGQRDLVINYSGNGANVAVGTGRMYNAAGSSSVKRNLVAANYTTGPFKVAAGLYQARFDAGYGHDIDVITAGVKYQATSKASVGVEYTESKDKTATANKSKVYGLAGLYDFSKRTQGYGLIGKSDNSGASFLNPIYGGPTLTTADSTVYTVGLRHSF